MWRAFTCVKPMGLIRGSVTKKVDSGIVNYSLVISNGPGVVLNVNLRR